MRGFLGKINKIFHRRLVLVLEKSNERGILGGSKILCKEVKDCCTTRLAVNFIVGLRNDQEKLC